MKELGDFKNICNGLEKLKEYQFFIEKDYKGLKDIWEVNFDKVKKITYNIKRSIYSSGMDWNDYLLVASCSLYESIYCFDVRLEIPFIAFVIVRLKSDIYKHVREQLKNSNKALNRAILENWQDEEYKHPKTESPFRDYLNEYKTEQYIRIIKNTKLLNSNERKAILERIEQSKYSRKKKNRDLKKKDIQKIDNAYQRGKHKLINSKHSN